MPEPVLPKRFRFLRELGEGGMGVVYEALDEERGVRVAVKTVRDLTAESLQRFKREFRALADLHHPNIVTLGELFSEGRNWFFSMELVEGSDFLAHVRPVEARLRALEALSAASASSVSAMAAAPTVRFTRSEHGERGFDEERLRSALRQLAEALPALHAAGVVHRDIKPSNIRVTGAGRLVLLDFGLAIDSTKDRSSGMKVSGTPAYMAPEQAMSAPVGPEADWYAVGVVLYEALTGALPFEGAPFEVLSKKQSVAPQRPRALVPDVPEDLDALCVALLHSDPKSRPTVAHVQRVLGAAHTAPRLSHPSVSSAGEQATFVGRAEELETLRAAFRDSRNGASVSVLVKGESGVGKSCLVRRFVATLGADEPDLVVLAGRCYEREAVPFKAFDGVIDALVQVLIREGGGLAERILPTRPGPLVQVFPVLRRVAAFADAVRRPAAVADPVDLRNRAFATMREMLSRLATARPCVIVVDDLQWADTDSLALLTEIMRTPEEPQLLFVATIRSASSDASSAMLKVASLVRFVGVALGGRARSIVMDRMPEEDARTLIARLLEREAPAASEFATTIAREAGGHPLFIDALVRHAAISGATTASTRLEDALWARVESLASGPRHVMQLLAVAGAPVAQETLAAAVGGDPAELGRHVSLLRAAHLASTTGARAADTIEPYHDRVRTAVLESIGEDDRVACHRALARALERTPGRETEALARHWRGAGNDAQAAKYSALAAEEAAGALAFDRAVALYDTAIELGPPGGAERGALLEKLGDALANAGLGARAAAAYGEASRGAQAARSLDLQRRSADQLLRAGYFDEGLAAIGRVLAAVGLALPRSSLSALLFFLAYRVYLRLRGLGFRARDESEIAATELTRVDICWSVAFGLAFADNLQGAAFQARSLVLALRSGERCRIARGIALEAGYVSRAGGPALRRTEALLDRAHALARESGDAYTTGWVHCSSGVAHYFAGKYKRALEDLERGKAIWSEVPGSVWELDTAAIYSASCLVQLGQIGRMARETPKAMREARQRGDLYAAVNLRIGLPNLAWLVDDQADGALAQIDEAMSEWSSRGFHVEHYFELLARTNALVYGGRAREAYAHVTARWSALRRSLLPFALQIVRVYTLHARARSAIATAGAEKQAADRESLLRDASRAARRIERESMDWATPMAKLLRAGLAMVSHGAERGGSERAVSLLRDAVHGFDAADMALYAAAARRQLGTVLGGDEGRELVRGADAWMTSESIKNPSRMTTMLAPGFGRGE